MRTDGKYKSPRRHVRPTVGAKAPRRQIRKASAMTQPGDILDNAKTQVSEAVDRLADELERLSLRIHANPELAFKEEKAAAWLTEFLATHGLEVERGVGGLPT